MKTWIVGIIVGGVVSIASSSASAWITHKASLRKEIFFKKDDFLGFIGKWEQDNLSKDVLETFNDRVPHLTGYFRRNRRYFLRKRKFQTLCVAISGIQTRQIESHPDKYRQEIAKGLKNLADFIG